MDTIGHNPEDESNIHTPEHNKLEVVPPEVVEDINRQSDVMGRIKPLSHEELIGLSNVVLPEGEEGGMFEDLEAFTGNSNAFISIIEDMCDPETDADRCDEEEELDATAEGMCDNLVPILKSMKDFCDSDASFIEFAAGLIYGDIAYRRGRLGELFGREDLFVAPSYKKVAKAAAKRLLEPNAVGRLTDYYARSVYADLKMVRVLLEGVWFRQDVRATRLYMARACELLEEINNPKKLNNSGFSGLWKRLTSRKS